MYLMCCKVDHFNSYLFCIYHNEQCSNVLTNTKIAKWKKEMHDINTASIENIKQEINAVLIQYINPQNKLKVE